MKYNATKFSISNLIVFLVISFLGVSAHAREQCNDITVYRQGGCSSGSNVCVQVTRETVRKCYEVPDYAGPSFGGPSTGQNGGGGSGGSEGTPPPPPKPEQPKKCAQMILDVDAVRDACRVIESNTAESLANSCPNLTHYVEGMGSAGFSFRDVFNFAFGGTWGATYNRQCEARLSFKLGAKLEACDFSASKSKAAIGPCN